MRPYKFRIVGISNSAGGIEVFHRFSEHMHRDCGMAIILILHLPADRKNLLLGFFNVRLHAYHRSCHSKSSAANRPESGGITTITFNPSNN